MEPAKLAWNLLNRHDKRRFWLLLGLMLINGGLEMCGMGVIFPYIGLINDPGLMEHNATLHRIGQTLGGMSFDHFVVFLSVLLLGIFLFKNVFGLFLQNMLLRFAFSKQLDLGRMQMSTCIVRPYEYFLSHNSADIVRNLTSSIPAVCIGVIVPWLNLLTEVCMVTGVAVLILYMQPLPAVVALGVTGPLAYLLFKACKRQILKYGEDQNKEYRTMVKHSTEALQGIKEIKASGRGDFFVDRYLQSARLFLHAMRMNNFLAAMPRAALEVMMITAITSVVLVVLYFSHDQIQKIVPLLAVYAAAAVRVLPAFNRIIIAMNGIRFNHASLLVVTEEQRECERLGAMQVAQAQGAQGPVRGFQHAVELLGIGFRYAGSSEALFDGLSLTIKRGESVAFIGRSGSGKSTLVDLILGLLEPGSGVVKVDGEAIRGAVPAWQRQVGYIPQQIYLVDDTLARNVALGISEADTDFARLHEVIAMADLQELIDELPQGLNTVVGEHGVMLSGGQRQRIGIARALYRRPALLIMDEATSALDNISERKVIQAISALGDTLTVVMVAHRLSTVRYCDQVYLLDKGRVVDFGDYEHIAERHPYFINPGGAGVETMPVAEIGRMA